MASCGCYLVSELIKVYVTEYKYSTLQGSDVIPRALLIKRKIQLVAQARLEKGLMTQELLCRVHDNTMAINNKKHSSKMASSSFCNCYSSLFLIFYRNKKSNLLNNINISDKNIRTVNDKLAEKGAY